MIDTIAIDDYALLDTVQNLWVCRLCYAPMRPVYDNVGFDEQPAWEVAGYEACTHYKDTEEATEA